MRISFFERLHDGLLRDIAVALIATSPHSTPRAVSTIDVVAGGELHRCFRVKVIHLAHVLKTNTDYFCHIYIHSP